ncbi:MAG TPA: NAD(P)H-binding protein [Polyangiaceae bacterium]|nr:NAD(P)H-binding protein [Polyangiaceae bacterium]
MTTRFGYRKVLVVGAKGTVGSEATRALLERGAAVRALVRSLRGTERLDACEFVVGDLKDDKATAAALEGVSAAFYVSPHEPDEETLAETFVRACERARVRLVFVGVHADAPTRLQRALKRFMFGRLLSPYAPKFRISERVRRSSADPVVLMPTNYFQNDELFLDQIAAGHFTQPFERAVNRVDVRDLGAAAARACLDPTLPSGAYPVVGPASLDAAACAEIWANELGSDVRYVRDESLEALRSALAGKLSGKKRQDFTASYSAIRRYELPTSQAELARTAALIEREPTPYAAYVRDAVKRLRAAREANTAAQ